MCTWYDILDTTPTINFNKEEKQIIQHLTFSLQMSYFGWTQPA